MPLAYDIAPGLVLALTNAPPRLAVRDDAVLDIGGGLLIQPAPPPEPPVPPGADDRLINTTNGLGGFTTPFTSSTGIIIVRIAGRNNAASLPGISVTWNGVAMTKAVEVSTAAAGSAFATLFGIKGDAGTHDIVVSTTGSAGMALVRIADLAALDASWVGAIGQASSPLAQFLDVSVTPQGATGVVAQLAAFAAPDLGGVTNSVDGVTQQWYGETTVVEGAELVTNPAFSAATGWTQGVGWNIAGGVANHVGNTGFLTQPINLTAGVSYLHRFTMTISTVGGQVPYVGGILQGTGISAPGTYASPYLATATASKAVGLQTTFSNTSTISLISLKAQLATAAAFYTVANTGGARDFTFSSSQSRRAPCAAIAVELKGAVLAT